MRDRPGCELRSNVVFVGRLFATPDQAWAHGSCLWSGGLHVSAVRRRPTAAGRCSDTSESFMSEAAPQHVPGMLDEIVHWLAPREGQILVDGTLGGGGHTRALAERVGRQGRVIALDRDPAALRAAEKNLQGLSVTLVESN